MEIDNNSQTLSLSLSSSFLGAPSSELFSDDCRIAYRDLTGHSQNDTQQWNGGPAAAKSRVPSFLFSSRLLF